MNPQIHIIFHAGCADGVMSAWLIKRLFTSVSVVFHEGSYASPPPLDQINEIDSVIMVDFSYPRDVILEIAEAASFVTILDHHASAQEALVDLPENVHAEFDMDRSGAMITWDYMHANWIGGSGLRKDTDPNRPAPNLVRHVQDCDLWRFKLIHAHEMRALIQSFPPQLEGWDDLFELMNGDLTDPNHDAVKQGTALLRKDNMMIDTIAATARPININGIEILAAASPYSYGSSVAGKLAERSLAAGGPGVGAYYIDHPDDRQWGLRSIALADGTVTFDCIALARKFGGGGHPTATGFRTEWGHTLAPIYGFDDVRGRAIG